MISPQEFQRFRFFAGAPYSLLNKLANFSATRQFRAGERLLVEGGFATHLLIVKTGQVDIVYLMGDDHEVAAETAVSGDVIAWSAVLEPYHLTASAIATHDGELIEIDGHKLLELCETDSLLGYQLMKEIAKGLRDRLTGLRVQMAAAAAN